MPADASIACLSSAPARSQADSVVQLVQTARSPMVG